MQKLGDYIREVDVRNKDLKVTNLLGVSINKSFIPSIANLIGADLSNYKIIERKHFVYVPVTSRNGEKLSIALLNDCENAIVSQSYTVFEIIDEEKLLPEYLMMWFKRPEFDRYARFHSHGSAREVFDWSEMCDVLLPIPSIEQQREIVSEYETISKRIKLNEQIIQNLEATAQTLYHKMFVEGIDKENLPEGWRIGTLGEVCEIKYGKAHEGIHDGLIPIYGSGGIMRFGNKSLYTNESVLIPRKGSLNNIFFVDNPFWTVDTMFYTEMKLSCVAKYVYFNLKQYDFLSMDAGSAVPSMTTSVLNQIELIIPTLDTLEQFDNQVSTFFSKNKIKKQENEKLTELQSLLLAKMGR
ncbi:MAG: restriction endonuclease subunit S [Bacteroidales bacterium]|nr:restriction endonuclease subunit S [Bacteroidales bacterium]